MSVDERITTILVDTCAFRDANSDFIGILTNLAFLRDSLKKESLNDVIPKSLLMDIQVLLNTNEEEISLEDFRTNVVRMINVVLIRLQGIYKLIIYS